MKKVFLVAIIFLSTKMTSLACAACEKQQPKITKGITHGSGPQSDWDYVIIGFVALIVIVSFVYSIKWLVKPGERESSHIKRSSFILE